MGERDLRLREARDDEAESLLAIERAAFAAYQLDPPSSVFRETPDDIRAKMSHGTFLVAELDGGPAGMIYCQPEDGFCYLGRLAVLPGRQGRGIARALLVAAERRAAALGAPAARLNVRLALPRLIGTYARCGYRTIAERCHPGYAAPTYVTMEKRLERCLD